MTKETEGVRDPPRTFGGIVRMLGPGIIVAGGIVGSGELTYLETDYTVVSTTNSLNLSEPNQ